jgi:hypothetical protein
MIGQDLQTRPDDEQHEKHIEEVLELQPPRETRVYRRRGLGNAGMLLDKCSHGRQLAQTLRESDKKYQRRSPDRQAPKRIDPVPTNTDPWGDPLVWGHPVIESDAVVSIAKLRAEWLWRRRLLVLEHRAIAFYRR